MLRSITDDRFKAELPYRTVCFPRSWLIPPILVCFSVFQFKVVPSVAKNDLQTVAAHSLCLEVMDGELFDAILLCSTQGTVFKNPLDKTLVILCIVVVVLECQPFPDKFSNPLQRCLHVFHSHPHPLEPEEIARPWTCIQVTALSWCT